MTITQPYHQRPIRFVEVFQCGDWRIKTYRISSHRAVICDYDLAKAKACVATWLERSNDYPLPTYKVATLILHACKEGVFAIINWWIDDNMLQNFVYLNRAPAAQFELYSANGVVTCVWEMAIWWHERNAWVKHILQQHLAPDWEAYLNDQLNIDL
jgi:hypothetical protein